MNGQFSVVSSQVTEPTLAPLHSSSSPFSSVAERCCANTPRMRASAGPSMSPMAQVPALGLRRFRLPTAANSPVRSPL